VGGHHDFLESKLIVRALESDKGGRISGKRGGVYRSRYKEREEECGRKDGGRDAHCRKGKHEHWKGQAGGGR